MNVYTHIHLGHSCLDGSFLPYTSIKINLTILLPFALRNLSQLCHQNCFFYVHQTFVYTTSMTQFGVYMYVYIHECLPIP
jgi:hypothetical protein